tara:strand:+ start:396 stop:1727 length:1332 start_codon:yes stop_codon:yes gene_type:complete
MRLSLKQTEAYDLALNGKNDVILYGGAIRGGKTWWLLLTFIALCSKYPKSRWVIIRENLPNLKRNTIPSLQKILDEGLSLHVESFNQDTYTLKFKNGSQLMFMSENYDQDKDLERFKGLEINGAGCEEISEIQEATFDKLLERTGTWLVKGLKIPSMILATCNPTHNWVKERFYDPWANDNLPDSWAYIQAKITDNPFLPPEYLEGLKRNLPPLQYQRFVEGDWEVIEVGNRFANDWDDETHIKSCWHKKEYPLHISMDFNIDPFGFIFYQIYQDAEGWHFWVFDEATIKAGTIGKAVGEIKRKFTPSDMWRCVITGDYNGNKRELSQADHASNFEQIRRELGIKPKQIQTSANPKHVNSRNDLNYVLYHSGEGKDKIDFRIDPRCENTIRDMRFVEANGEGGIIKSNRKDLHQLADHFDCVRYAVNHKDVMNWIRWRQKLYI